MRSARAARHRGAAGAGGELPLGRHGGICLRRGHRPVLLPRSQHAPAGGTRRDRAGDRCRSGRVDGATRRRRSAAAGHAGAHAAGRVHPGAAVRRRPGEELPAQRRSADRGGVPAADARVDGWVERGTEVPAWYDPMLAKLIVTAPDREQALASSTPRWPPRAWPASRPTWATCARWCATRCSAKAGRSRASSTASTSAPRPSKWWSPACRPACRTGPGAWATGTWACRPAAPWTPTPTAWPTAWWATPTTRPRWRSRSPAPRCASTPTR